MHLITNALFLTSRLTIYFHSKYCIFNELSASKFCTHFNSCWTVFPDLSCTIDLVNSLNSLFFSSLELEAPFKNISNSKTSKQPWLNEYSEL